MAGNEMVIEPFDGAGNEPAGAFAAGAAERADAGSRRGLRLGDGLGGRLRDSDLLLLLEPRLRTRQPGQDSRGGANIDSARLGRRAAAAGRVRDARRLLRPDLLPARDGRGRLRSRRLVRARTFPSPG